MIKTKSEFYILHAQKLRAGASGAFHCCWSMSVSCDEWRTHTHTHTETHRCTALLQALSLHVESCSHFVPVPNSKHKEKTRIICSSTLKGIQNLSLHPRSLVCLTVCECPADQMIEDLLRICLIVYSCF